MEQLRVNALNDAECEVQIELDVDFTQGHRHITLSLSHLPVEKAVLNHTAGRGECLYVRMHTEPKTLNSKTRNT